MKQGPKAAPLVTVKSGEIQEVEHRDLDVMRWAHCELMFPLRRRLMKSMNK